LFVLSFMILSCDFKSHYPENTVHDNKNMKKIIFDNLAAVEYDANLTSQVINQKSTVIILLQLSPCRHPIAGKPFP
jgi:hypothetical protein